MQNIYQAQSEIEYIPYTYIIGWRQHNVWYFGSESASITKIANPKNLWTTYFTSSEKVKQFRSLYGEPDIVKVVKTFVTADEARTAESIYLSRINAAQRPNWLNQHNGTDKFHTSGFKLINNGKEHRMIPHSQPIPEGWIVGRSEQKLKKYIEAAQKRTNHFTPDAHLKSAQYRQGKKLFNNGVIQKFIDPCLVPNGWTQGQLSSKSNKASQRLTGTRLSAITKDKISQAHKGNKWFTNNIEEIQATECPDGWRPGRLPITDKARKNRGLARKGLRWFTNGQVSKQFRDTDNIPPGFKPGRIISN